MTDDDKALVDGLRLLANTARKMSWVGHSPMLAPKVLNKSADSIESLSAQNERLREALEYIQPFLEDYLDVALENGHPELIGHATLAVKEAAAALGDTK